MLTYGKGWANTSATYTFALDVYDISPSEGSVMGGTVLTITSSNLIPYKMVGGKVKHTEYTLFFGHDGLFHEGVTKNTVNENPASEEWTNGWNRGYKCQVIQGEGEGREVKQN